MKSTFLELIDRELLLAGAGKPSRIICKMNQLEDREVTDALYLASQAGVRIDCIVRGFCCLRAGVPGLSESSGGVAVPMVAGVAVVFTLWAIRMFRTGRRLRP